jgi:hypothetical protein
MAKIGLEYFRLDTNRYHDIRIKRLKKEHGCEGLAVYDYILTEIYRVKGCYMEWDENVLFDISDFFDIEESTINSIILSCCKIGLFNESLLKSGYLSSESIQRRYVEMCTAAKRKDAKVPEFLRITPNVSGSIPEETAKLPEELPKVPEESGFIPEEINKVKYSIVNNSIINNNNTPEIIFDYETGIKPVDDFHAAQIKTIRQHYDEFMTKDSTQKELMAMDKKLSTRQIEVGCMGFVQSLITKGHTMEDIYPKFKEHFRNWFNKYGANNLKEVPKERIEAEFRKFKKYEYAQ